MFLDLFHTEDADGIRVSAAQGSAFAKEIAGDFNPIHDAGNPRFCVPGDLLFALVLARCGVAEQMTFRFTGMVGADAALTLADGDPGVRLLDAGGKSCLEVTSRGEVSRDPLLLESLVRSYVAFSGQNFPHILVPLMEQHGVMINTERPLVIYESMAFSLDRLDIGAVDLTLVDKRLEAQGRRGDACLDYRLDADGATVGRGTKRLVLSGLRGYDAAALQGLVERYAGWKAAYAATGG
ncbi:MAG: DUF3581 domain-containing protein [Thiohalocapsa sp.]|nr:DUF3581 domain-containing protein [Thiohalocapsa sp.]